MRLKESEGLFVKRSTLMDALYFDKPNDEPGGNILSVLVCKLRVKLAGSGYVIATGSGEGYCLSRAPEC
jgi:DNA-binding response OmpR family regulator